LRKPELGVPQGKKDEVVASVEQKKSSGQKSILPAGGTQSVGVLPPGMGFLWGRKGPGQVKLVVIVGGKKKNKKSY